jgi:Cu/Ag efflux pump CusA
LIIFILFKNKNNSKIQERRFEKKSIAILLFIFIITFLLFFFLIKELNSALAIALNLPNFEYGSNFTYY